MAIRLTLGLTIGLASVVSSTAVPDTLCWTIASDESTRCLEDPGREASSGYDCSQLSSCSAQAFTLGSCGWCWDASTTEGQQHGGRAGGVFGPSDGECSDWTWSAAECQNHVDCAGDVPTCEVSEWGVE